MFKIKIQEQDRHFELKIKDDKKDNLPVLIDAISDSELINSNKIRRKLKKIAWLLYKDFRDKAKLYGRALIHNIGNTELQIRQTIERYTIKIDQKVSLKERIELFSKIIGEDPQKFAKDLLFLEQRSKDLDAQLIGINLLVGKGYTPDFSQKHNLADLILRCASTFLPVLKEYNSKINFKDLENIDIQTDFRLFNCAMYHFFDNAQKYIKPNNDIFISVDFEAKELYFKMHSRVIEDRERILIFQEGFSGDHSGGQRGEGLGLYIFALVLDKLEAIPDVKCDEKTRLGLENTMYQDNTFIIKFSGATLYKGS